MGIKDQLKKAYSDIKVTAGKVTDSIKREYRRNQLQAELDEMYRTLGQIRYEELRKLDNAEEGSKELYSEITRLREEIAGMDKGDLSSSICKSCGKTVKSDQSFCPHCGSSLNPETGDDPNER